MEDETEASPRKKGAVSRTGIPLSLIGNKLIDG